jgi:hypothetical protein
MDGWIEVIELRDAVRNEVKVDFATMTTPLSLFGDVKGKEHLANIMGDLISNPFSRAYFSPSAPD